MPVVESGFAPPLPLRNGHVQTILGALLPRPGPLPDRRERLELPDGDFLDLDWFEGGHPRLAILSHGLEGHSGDPAIRAIAGVLRQRGWDVLAWNFRGCSGEPNRLLRFYHSGETEDLRQLIRRSAESYGHIALVGLSLGGNVTLKYLGESATHPAVKSAVAISVPVDLASSARVLDDRRMNELYLRRFMKRLILKVEAKALRFPGALATAGLRQTRSFREFDDRYTAPVHGFASGEEYWRLSSSRPHLPAITVPTLLLNAQDDPFLDRPSFPWDEARASESFFLETPKSGGHLGFLGCGRLWLAGRVGAFLNGKSA